MARCTCTAHLGILERHIIFQVTRTTRQLYISDQPCDDDRLFKSDGIWLIELNTLKELDEFRKRYSPVSDEVIRVDRGVVIYDGHGAQDWTVLEIYDGYRE